MTMAFMGKIYKVINSVDSFVYIGSTRQKKISSRMGNHRTRAKELDRQSKFYCHMRNIGIENFKIQTIREVLCQSKEELEQHEFEEMKQIPPDLLLNEDTEYKQKSEAHGQKVGESQRGNKHYNWKFGSVFERQGISTDGFEFEGWCFAYQCQTTKKQKRFQFSIKKYGYDKAKEMALVKQKEIFPQLQNINVI